MFLWYLSVWVEGNVAFSDESERKGCIEKCFRDRNCGRAEWIDQVTVGVSGKELE